MDLPVAWGEQDAFGHLNNVVYFRYFENVRMYYDILNRNEPPYRPLGDAQAEMNSRPPR